MYKILKSLNLSLKEKLNVFIVKDDNESNDLLKEIIAKENISSIYFNNDYSPYSQKRDSLIKKLCIDTCISCNTYHDILLFGKIFPKIYQKFTPFYDHILKIFKPKLPEYISKMDKKCYKLQDYSETSKNIEKLATVYINGKTVSKFENTIIDRDFLFDYIKSISDKLIHYDKIKDVMSHGTTELSVFIKFGLLSVRELYSIFKVNKGIVRQLFWRDFYYNISVNFPNSLSKNQMNFNFIWNNDNVQFELWKSGNTGFPLIDAGMRQMNETGIMHNRARLVTANFLTKILMIDWKIGEKHFSNSLIDYDYVINNLNWQSVTGTHHSSQPAFRVYNPFRQSKMYDKDAIYIKKWIPELSNVEPKDIHTWDTNYNKYLHIKYPKPCVNYTENKNLFLKNLKNK
jgi:deoxyribodipyrimidine photo-lyase